MPAPGSCAPSSPALSNASMRPEAGIPKLGAPIVVVAGPTASGKSELAQCIAEAIGGEVISADSMQVYRGMDIGTGKLPASERRVTHWGLDLVEPGEPYSVALYQRYARTVAADIDARGARVVLCGGTGLYIRGVIDGYEYPQGDQLGNPERQKYQELLDQVGPQALWERLNAVDPDSAALVHPNNAKRVVRAFELLAQGTSYARQNERLKSIPQVVPAVYLVLDMPRELLNARIDARVDGMFASGLVDEVRGLLDAGLRDAVTAPQAIGYKEVVATLDGVCTMEEARQQIKLASHRYAKRQRSWFRADKRAIWLDATLPPEQLLASALGAIERAGC